MARQYFSTCSFEVDGEQETNEALSILCIDTELAQSISHLFGCVPLALDTDESGLLIRVAMGQGEAARSATLSDLDDWPPIEDWMRLTGDLETTGFDKHLGKVRVPNFTANQQHELKAERSGRSQLGGDVPIGFSPAKTGKPNDTQYIGTLATQDFPVLPFDLHLSIPIFDEYSTLILDYHDPMAPIIVDRDQVEEKYIQSLSGVVENATQAGWEPVSFGVESTSKWIKEPDLGVSGVPAFIQDSVLPKSPKTGRLMPFLCQFSSINGPKLKQSSIGAIEDPEYFNDHMAFFGDGAVFLFWEKETRLLAFVMQNT
ncbi:hypothetical protein [Pseudovibrio sp. Ad37]|uniref:hypothetical protein n=1 Tax=Pseudovibrio sp. Ad37 TaxID=989422 RepID=UPI0007AE4388|nr:hypothetical protein [Pseudovibrio sp. Ad37]KZL28838.1 hypothetical protein PsAD37_00628 [Pseudovibrio sp. Ad37]